MFFQSLWGLLTILSVAYGMIIMSAHTGTKFYVVWFAIAIIFALFFAAAHFHIFKKIGIVLKCVVAFALVICIAAAMFVEVSILKDFNSAGEESLDYIIVLGAHIRDDGPSTVLKYRLDTAVKYLDENPDTICIVTGAQGANESMTEAEGMSGYLQEQGISEERIIKEENATNTYANIKNSAQFIDIERQSVGIVTNNYHICRSVGMAHKYGYENVCGIAAPSSKLFLPNNMLRESMSFVKDKLMGRF